MIRWAPLVIAAALVLAGCDQAPFVKQPPAKYQKPGAFLVATHPTEAMPTVCAGASTVGEPPGSLVACFQGVAVQMPNPCEWPDDNYASLFCHEFGHAQGWPANHPDN